jgi:hypothetical protein
MKEFTFETKYAAMAAVVKMARHMAVGRTQWAMTDVPTIMPD